MGPEWVSIIALVALLVIGMPLPINPGTSADAGLVDVGAFSTSGELTLVSPLLVRAAFVLPGR